MKQKTQVRAWLRQRKIRRKLDARLLEQMGIKPDQKPTGLRPNPGVTDNRLTQAKIARPGTPGP